VGRRQSGSLDRLPSGRWRARYRGHDGHRHSAVFRTKGDADVWLAAQQTDSRRGNWVDPRLGRVTVADWAQIWMETNVHLRPSTRAGYESKLRSQVLPRLGPTPVIELDTPAIRRFVAQLARDGVSSGSILATRTVVRLILATAVEAGALPANPCAGVKVPRTRKPEMHCLTAEQVEDLAHAISCPVPKPAGHGAQPHWRTELPEYGVLVRFAAYTGLRAGEIAGLTERDLDFVRSAVTVGRSATEVNGHLVYGPTKNYQRRSVPLPTFLRDDLAALLQDRRHDPANPVFTAPAGGALRHKNFYRRHFKRAVVQAGLPETVRFHDLRHTFAGFLIAQGAHPRAIMERMGHSSIQVTLGTYGHLLPGIDERLTNGLDDLGRSARQRPRSPIGGDHTSARESKGDSVGSRLGHA
jgi:integrase